MIIGVPKEIKKDENRVAITPAGAAAMVKEGHRVLVETGAGLGSGIKDQEYRSAGAEMLSSPGEIYHSSEMIYKVKEPQQEEYDLLKEGQVLFTFLHLAAEPELTGVLVEKKVVGIAYETVEVNGSLPLLAPMSEVAGKMAVQNGARVLEKINGGEGILLGGVPGVAPAKVVIIGGGIVGANAAKIAVGMGADVTICDINVQRLRYLDDIFGNKITTLISNQYSLAEVISKTDLLIGAVLIPGARAPKLVTEKMVKNMKSGAAIVDVAIDQGGCIETIDHTTTHSAPTYERHGVLHYAVPNIPGAVPRTSTFALSNVTLPYALQLANKGYRNILDENGPLAHGFNTIEGKITHQGVAEALSLPFEKVS